MFFPGVVGGRGFCYVIVAVCRATLLEINNEVAAAVTAEAVVGFLLWVRKLAQTPPEYCILHVYFECFKYLVLRVLAVSPVLMDEILRVPGV